MAINAETRYPGKIAPSSPEYPYGKAQNVTTPGDGTGTPWEAAIVNDLFGFQQAVLSEAQLTPSGTPEKVGASQYLEGLKRIFGVKYIDDVAALTALDLVEGRVYVTKENATGSGRGGATYVAKSAATPVRAHIDHVGNNSLVAVFQPVNGTITATQMGFTGESLSPSTQDYKSVTYNVDRWSQNQDFLTALDSFIDADGIHTLDIEDLFLYVSSVSIKQWVGKRITGAGSKACGIIKGAINWADGTRAAWVDNIGFYGEIAYLSLPLPVTIDPLLENDPGYFWYLDDLAFGFGFGALGAATASSEGNTNGIMVENCYFEMRDAVISGGSAPNNEDRPKVWNVTFRNNETKGVMFHGFASIHFRYSKVYGNHFYEHYNGYACDFSLGTQDSEFFSNTGDRLAAGFKSEPRSFDASFRNKFYNNRLVVRWRWASTGAGFNLLFRTKGREVEMYDNSLTCFDFTPIDKYALNLEGLSTNIKNNDFYIKGTPDTNFLWFAQLKNGIDVPTAGQQLLFKNNNIYNETAHKLTAALQITEVSGDTFSLIDVTDNICSGPWSSFVRPEFGSALAIVDRINIVNNVFPNTALFRPNSAFTFNYIDIRENTVTPQDTDTVVNLGFITLTDKVVIKNNILKSEEGGAGTVSFAAATNNTGDLSAADIEVSGNALSPFTGSLLYLFGGGVDLPVDNVIISANTVRWNGSSSFTNFVLAKGAAVFAMNANTLINQLDTATGFIGRPTNGANSKYENNLTMGAITDAPG